jgi:hypothetical protein
VQCYYESLHKSTLHRRLEEQKLLLHECFHNLQIGQEGPPLVGLPTGLDVCLQNRKILHPFEKLFNKGFERRNTL